MSTHKHLIEQFIATRSHTNQICAPLKIEDFVIQPIDFVSPPKWHLGHTTWFFEEFVLVAFAKNYKRFNSKYAYVFNSYYESMGDRVVRTNRGNLSRPCVEEIYKYRDYVTEHLTAFMQDGLTNQIAAVIEIGVHHEQQHQELLLTDIKFILGNNPLQPIYRHDFKEDDLTQPDRSQEPMVQIPEGIYHIGNNEDGFSYDNEHGVHKVFLQEFQISKTLVTNKEWLDFINDGGYQDVSLWHAEAWDWIKNNGIKAPLYWHHNNNSQEVYQLSGVHSLNLNAAVSHISYYEAFAYAQWSGMRLPTEFEWEASQKLFKWGDRWEWTESAYLPYPNYKKPAGALGEYNGKFMVNQKVLRGASIATPQGHERPTYRNFFHPHLRWQYTGLRLAK